MRLGRRRPLIAESAPAIDLAQAYRQLVEANTQLAELARLAGIDPLTGLRNRRGMVESLDAAIATLGNDQHMSVLYCDLDRFKQVNDHLGHRGGDRFLTMVAERIADAVGTAGSTCRVGGDEFVVVLPLHGASAAAEVAHRVVDALARPVLIDGRAVPSSASVGVATAPQHGRTGTAVGRHANTALFHAKRTGRNSVAVFDPAMQRQHSASVHAEHTLRRAIESGDVIPFFQPELDAVSGSVIGAELLARWLRPDGSIAAAADFVGLADRAGLLDQLTDRMLALARPDIRRLQALGLPNGFRFRVNLGPASTDRAWRGVTVEHLVRGIDPAVMTVDVVESIAAADVCAAAATFSSFREAGGRVCLDDFGRGVTSLSLLRQIPLDEVRIDRQTIDSVTAHPHDRAIVRSIIALARELDLVVSADGIETGAQSDVLTALGCTRQQGHLYSPAIPMDQFESFLHERGATNHSTASRVN
jgi:diguanylate cyclase (GGDEF)-like protein